MTRNLSKILLLALLCGAPLAASSVREISFDSLSRGAKRVIGGEVVKVVSTVGENGYIYSDVTVLVRNAAPRSLEGQPYTFRTIGGEVDGRTLFIQGMPRFEVGQQLALFLHDSPNTALGPTVGLWQGIFFMNKDAATGRQVMLDAGRRPVIGIDGAKLIHGPKASDANQGDGVTGGRESGAMAVDTFFETVRAYRAGEGF